jgi:hypothetical protein
MSKPFSSRRRVIQSMAGLAIGAGLPEWFIQREALAAGATGTAVPATQPKLPVALIGCGGRGQYVADHDGSKYVNVVAICDVDSRQTDQALEKFKGAEVYKDFRKVMERKDIKAVINATPDHWHTLINLHDRGRPEGRPVREGY